MCSIQPLENTKTVAMSLSCGRVEMSHIKRKLSNGGQNSYKECTWQPCTPVRDF